MVFSSLENAISHCPGASRPGGSAGYHAGNRSWKPRLLDFLCSVGNASPWPVLEEVLGMGDHADFVRVSDSTGYLQVVCASVPSRRAAGVGLCSTWLLARCVSGIDNQPSRVYGVGQHGQIRNVISDAAPKDEYGDFIEWN